MIENIDASTSTADDLILTGNALNNTIYAGTGANNALIGGLGNDTYIVKSDNNTITEAASNVKSSGIDTVKLIADYDKTVFELADNIEFLDGSSISTGIELIGNGTVNTITGGIGSDSIEGGEGADMMIGGAGDDIYKVDNALDKITEAVNYGNDTVMVAEHVDFGPVSGAYNLYANVETIDFRELILDAEQQEIFGKKALTMNGNALDNTIYLSNDFGQFMKTYAGNGNDTIYGGGSNDYIDAGAGNDTILGGGGTNSLFGGAGNDIYQVDGSGEDIVNDSAGIDTIELFDTGAILDGGSFSMASYKGVENLDASAMNLDGMVLSGNDSDNMITGTDGNDTISGGKGVNTLKGGLGDDTYLLNGSEKSTTIVDADGNNQLQLVVDANNKFGGLSAATISMENFQGINSIDASQISATNMTIIGNAANNTITGAAGTSTLNGAAGDDIYMVSGLETSLTIADTSGNDTVRLIADENGEFAGGNTYSIAANTTVENIDASIITSGMTLTGNSLNNTIIGGIGDDTLSGGLGSNALEGGDGDDNYLITGTETATTITDTDGNDTLKLVATAGAFTGSSTVSLAGYDSVENLDASGISTTSLTLSGNDLDNTILGGADNDSIFGGLGENSLVGGAGNDTYLIDGNETSTSLTDTNGTDTLKLVATEGAFAGNATISLADYTSVENLNASDITDTDLTLSGTSANNILWGGAGDDEIVGDAGDDRLYGNDGDDVLSGSTGSKIYVGGKGNDTYVFNGSEDSITIIEEASEGNDTIILNSTEKFAGLDDYSLDLNDYSNVENIDGSLVNGTNLTLTGNNDNNIISGGADNDNIVGGAGDDTLYGNDGNDTFTASNGNKTYVGGSGNDTYLFNGNETSITLTEEAGGGKDTILLNTTGKFAGLDDYSLDLNDYSNIEDIDASLVGVTDLTLTGNDLNNTIMGGAGADYINAGTGSDSLYGNDGNDTFTGSTGFKTYFGGNGDDVYLYNGIEDSVSFVEEENAGNDTIVLNSTGKFEGLDDYSLSLVGINNVENLDGSLVNGTNLTLEGNDLNNLISGGAGDDFISGGDGNDTLYGNNGNDALGAGSGDDTLYGGEGNDELSGSTGNKTYVGGNGDDTYVFNGVETSITVTEDLNGGNDTIDLNTPGKYAGLDDYSLDLNDYSNVENIDGSIVDGTNLTLTGNDDNNVIIGGVDNDELSGGAGNDTLFGGLGANTLLGGAGNDTYFISGEETSTTITETSGNDTIALYSTTTSEGIGAFAGGTEYTIASKASIENIDASLITSDITLRGNDNNNNILGGSGNDSLFGDFENYPPLGPGEDEPTGSNDYLFGGAGNDALNGGAGNDTLVGGVGNDTLDGNYGNDTFSFFEGDQKDTIVSTSASDVIQIDTSTGISTSDMMFYKDTTGALYIDYTDDNVGFDVAKISTGGYNSSTIIQVGNSTISINTISQYLAGSGSAFTNLDTNGIDALTTASEATQVAALVGSWTTT